MKSKQPGSAFNKAKDLDHLTHRQLIGVLGLFLPGLLYVLAGVFPTHGLPRWDLLDSVSAYYHTGAGGIFVGIVFALSLFLFCYPGYKGDKEDRILGCIGGASALGVGFFPTKARPPLLDPDWWQPWMGDVHHVSAIILFGTFILFSAWLFRRTDKIKSEHSLAKKARDVVCLSCAAIMLICVCWALAASVTNQPIFLPEAIALGAFAVSWLAKGRAYRYAQRLLRYFSKSSAAT